MNRKLAGLTLLLLLAFTSLSHAQSGEWAWLGGPPGTNDGIPTYGTLGVPSTKNIPAMREGSGTWTDAKGNLWLFGGYGADSTLTSAGYGYLNDLWEYSPANATWTWVGGSNVVGPNYGQPGVYGTLGVPSPSNIPGGRAPAAIWQDSKGNVWMFGGGGMDSTDTFDGDGSLNDLWMYNPTTNEWTWMGGGTTVPHFNGGQPGVYGTLGVASSSNQPGGRVDSSSWTDAQGNFWLFGGSGDDVNGTIGELNDIWMYNPNTSEWTWEGGSTTAAGATAVVGGQGAAAAGNVPSGRNGAASWTDSQGNFWLFGGSGASGIYEDMWEFNPTTRQWAWLSGPTTPSIAASGDYGTQGTPSGSNVPPGRELGATWTDAAGNLWLFGGLGYDSTGNQNIFNDQWEYSPATNQWTWVNGSNSVASGGDYGPQGAPSASSMPGARYAPDFWKDNSGNFWLFGGLTPVVAEGNGFYSGYGFYSDLWEYFTPSAASSGPEVSISPFGLQFAVVAGEVSTAQQTTLSNPGTASLSISGITLSGTGAAAYQQTNTCGSSLAAGANCTISVTFSPAASQTYPATLSIASNATGSPQAVTLTGTGNILTSTTIFASATTLTTGSSLNLAATVASTVGNTIPTGTVTFDEDGTTIGTGTLSGSGVATYTVTSLALGAHSFTATYPGDTLHGSSASGSVTVTGAASEQISAPQWDWVAGGQTATFITGAPPVYGTLGTPSSTNYPGDVAGGTTWTDAHGNLWLFYGENGENDLWKYNIALGQWTWVSGINLYDTSYSLAGVYGTLGTPAAGNTPGGRDDNVSWIDTKGDLWIFGGSAADANGVFAPLNDLWMFNPTTSLWTWEGGSSTAVSAGLGQSGVYGTKGVASPTNVPGGRTQAMSWTDKSGNFWLFGGYGSDSTGAIADLNDLWEFSPTTGEWTWMGGASVANGLGVYGTEGVPAAGNVPGSRTGGTTWVDNSGNLWLFGGTGYTSNVYGTGFLNDLWKYSVSTNQWTWVSGSNLANAAGVYGTQGMSSSSNMPDGRQNAGGWVDSSGNLWLFGGADQYDPTSYLLSDFLNDLWVYLPSSNSWAWVAGSNTGNQPGVYGTLGTPSASNIPAGRYAPLTWTDANGNFWLMGGSNNELNTTFSDFDDFWTTGSAPTTPSGPLASLAPGSLAFSSTLGQTTTQQSVTLSNGGSSALSIAGISIVGTGASAFAETTTCGSTLAVGSNCSISITFTPTAPISYSAEVLVSDGAANSPQSVGLGGEGFVPTLPATTTTLGVTASTITVGASETITATVAETSGSAVPTGTVTFYDGNATLGTGTLNGSGVATYTTTALAVGSHSLTASYGGDANNATSTSSLIAVTVNAASGGNNPAIPVWTWVGGSEGKADTIPTSFGTQGVPSSSNFPGSQSEATTWTDANGNLWLFGGSQSDSSGHYGSGNDLWRYNPSTSQWTWMGGGTIDATFAAEGNYGTLGVASASNLPPGRLAGVGWTDASGNFWLFGGYADVDISGRYENLYYNDLWEYSTATNQWTWMGGNNTPTPSGFASGVFGTKGTPSTANIPSSRYGAVSWTDQNGNLWLMGGSGVDSAGTNAMLNDLWRYNPTSGQWTWITGNSAAGTNNGLSGTTSGVYGSQGVAAAGNTPGARYQGVSWIDASGNLWLFGGSGTDSVGGSGLLNDLWEYSPSANTWTWVGGGTTLPTTTTGLLEAPAGVYGTQSTPSASNIPGGRYIGAAWTDASGNFWLFGGVGADSTDTDGLLNDVWVYSPSANTWTWMGGSNMVNATAVYGTEGVASASNTPGSRSLMLYWTDLNHNLWLFGGGSGGYTGGDENPSTYYDLWTTGSAASTANPAVTLSQSSAFNFITPEGSTSSPQTLTVTNSGTANLSISGITLAGTNPGVFAETNTCGATLAPNGSCTISITYSPTTVENDYASIYIADNASNSPQSIALTGAGTGTLAPVALIYPTSLTFSPTLVNTTNSGQSITLANTGNAAMTGITASIIGANASDFAISSNTCSSLTLGGTCTISVTFTPPATGTFNATLSIVDNAGNSPQSVPLSGSGAAAQELASITPSFLAFANQPVNTASDAVTVTLANLGSTALTGISPAITGAASSVYAITANTCGTSLAAGASCSLFITFTPSSTATFNATLTVTDDAVNGPQLVPLSGTGTSASATSAATLSTTSLTFPNTDIGASSPLSVTVTNSGTQPLSVEGVITGDTLYDENNGLSAPGNVFAQTSTCGSTLAVGASCVITVTFTPAAGAPYSGTLLIADTSSSFAQAVSLTGVGTGGAGVSAALEPDPLLNFGTVALNTTSAPMTATLTNTGSATLTGITPSLSSGYTAISATTCGNSLAPGATCTISLTYTSNSAGNYGTTLSVADNAPGSPQQISLYGGTGCSSVSATSVTNCNPGGSVTDTSTFGVALAFQPATVTTATTTVASTEIIGKYQGTVVYDQTFPAAYGTPTVQAGVTAANAAIAAAGGSGAVIPAPALTSTSTSTSTASTSVYSRDPAAPVTTSGTSVTFGPATIEAGFEYSSSSLSPTDGQLTECTEASLPSSTIPTCYATDPGVFEVGAGQTDINTNYTLNYLIDTATTTTITTTTTAAYAINATAPTTAQAATPTFNVPGSTYSTAQSVTLSDSTPNATIYYTTNGTMPTTNSTVYSGTAITVSSTETIEAIATASGYSQSATATATYTISAPQAATPTFNPPGGNYSSAQSVTLSDTTSNATIYYTTNGTTPTTNSTVYSGTAIAVPSTETINAIAVASGDTASAMATAAYTITITTPTEIGQWAWMGGPNVIGSSTGVAPGIYGALGVAASTNLPPGRLDPQTWTDKSGNLWMMGGSSISQSVGAAYSNDLWEYSPSTLEWIWQGGANAVPAGTYGVGDTFGTQGTPSAQTVPGGRSGSFTWIDASGNLWLYGGFGVDDGYLLTTTDPIDVLYSFWKYTPSSGQWTWIAGSDYGIPADVVNSIPTYGVMGTPSSANFPGARYSGSTWTDSAGNLWMFGGNVVENLTYYSDGFGETATDGNDLWKFNPTSQEWTWEAGSEVTTSASVNLNCAPGVNGTLGQAAPGNTPSGRAGSSSWVDSAGNLWLFGGQGCGSFNINAGGNNDTWGALNDLWKFNTTTNEWTWEAGGTDTDQSGVYGTLGTPSPGNTPGEREGASAWTDKSGKFWLFGGSGYDSNGKYGSFNDLWMFDPSINEWTWEGGATTNSGSAGLPGIYGTLGVGVAGNIPGARGGGGAWTDASGNLWLFGGLGEDASGTLGDLNDLWEYGVLPSQTSAPQVQLSASALTFSSTVNVASAAQSVTLTNNGSASLSITGISFTGTGANAFGQTTTCGSTLAVNANCSISITFTPAAATSYSAMLSIADNASNSPQTVSLSGTGTVPSPVATNTMLAVSASTIVANASEMLTATVTEAGGSAAPTGKVTFYDGGTALGTGTLNASGVATYSTSSLALGANSITASYGGDAGNSASVSSAVVVTVTPPPAPAASIAPAGPLAFSASSGSASAAQSVTLSNTGAAALSITSIGITGSNASSFTQTNTCGSSLAAGSNCSISISFAPSSTGSFTAALSVADNASNSPQTIALNGTATSPPIPPTFTLGAVTVTGTVSPATAATYTLTVTPQNGSFSTPITLTASGVPTGYTAAFSPGSVTPGSSPATATLTISKTTIASARPAWLIAAPALALMTFFFVPGSRRRRILALLVLVAASLGTFAASGCGGGFGLPTTNYNVTITANGGGVTQSTTVEITVRQ